MKWEKHGNVLVAFIRKAREDVRGRLFQAQEALRIVRESDGYRLDFAGAVAGTWLPWESITDEVFPTVAKAQRAAHNYVKGNPATQRRSRFGS